MATTHNIMWWNLENLFEVETFPGRPEWLQKEVKGELKGWDDAVLTKKLNQLASIIAKVNNGSGPDILGCCEIENESVLLKLVSTLKPLLANRDYGVLHKDTKDQRGIDVAFIYDKNRYKWDGYLNSLEIMKRAATRDLVQVNLETIPGGKHLTLIGCHFPARMSGQYDTEPFRIMVGETLSYWVMRTVEIVSQKTGDSNVPIVVMGDFNDEPYNRSMTEYALAVPDKRILETGKIEYLFNPMWELMGRGENSYSFGNQKSLLDQMLFSKAIAVKEKPFKLKNVEIVAFPEMVKGKYRTPVRFSRPSESSSYNPNGYSDHLPVLSILEEV